jgi:signal transduction histidine kinase/DNA-binding response OmpR family regulator
MAFANLDRHECPESPARGAEMSMSGEVLIVDDIPDNLRVLGDILISQGLRVRLAPGGAYAMLSVGVRKPDLILMDIRMPELDGMEVCRRLRANPATAAIPVLFLSASQDPVERVACFEAGGVDFISKPFNAAEVLARVSSQLTIARQRAEIEAANARLAKQVSEESSGRQDAEAIAHDRQIRLDLALSATGMGSWAATSPDGHILVSPETSALLGCDAMGLPGGWRELVERFSPEDRPLIAAAWQCGLSNGSVFEAEGWWTGRDGRRRIRIRGRLSDGGVHGQRVVGLAWDVTEEHSLRQRLARSDKMEALGQLAGGLAHDFNNHLQVIVGNLDLLRQGAGLGAAGDPRLASIHRSVASASELVRDLLTFARRREAEQTAMQLAAATGELEALLRCSLGSSCALVLGTFDADARVVANREQFQNALLNLCINARDAMPLGGTVRIDAARGTVAGSRCRCCAHDVSGEYAIISVADDGCGIPADLQDRIFEPFFTTKPDGRGTGLGLAMVVGFVTSHHGHLLLDSQPGEGATFRILLPLAAGTAEPASAPADAAR